MELTGSMEAVDDERVRIKRLIRRDDTIQRIAINCGTWEEWTWTADDRQLASGSDGVDLSDPPTKVVHTRMTEVVGDPPNPTLKDLPGYPDMPLRYREVEYASFWGGSCLAVDGTIYQYLVSSNHPYMMPDGRFWPDFYMAYTKLIYSPDSGRTWHNQDGSTPVAWEKWDERSPENMVFSEEGSEGAFIGPRFLQMGRNYELNEDGFVYVYGEGGLGRAAEELYMFRVPRSAVLDRSSYEYFAGRQADGTADWERDISARAAVHTFPPGWVASKMDGGLPAGWSTNVVYNSPLDLYMMVAHGTGVGPTGGWYGKPSYLGFWVAPTPWGPFTQIHEEEAWTPAGELESRAFRPQIAPRWISADGKSFWLTWGDAGARGDFGLDSATGEYNPDRGALQILWNITDDNEFVRAFKAQTEDHWLHMGISMQRVDLILE